MLGQEWHPQDGILLQIAHDEGLVDGIVPDPARQGDHSVERNAGAICQGAMCSFIWLHFLSVFAA